MSNRILGLHHITAIAGNAQRNFDFYTRVLGVRLVKKTVNFDDPGTYHFYYGNEVGAPGTILTFFPWEGIQSGYAGTGTASEIGYSVPGGSLGFWKDRFDQYKVTQGPTAERFGELYLPFQDPDGLKLALTESKTPDTRKAWTTNDVKEESATKGFHSITLTLKSIKGTVAVLTDIFGYKLLEQEGNRYRFVTDAVENAAIVDIIEDPEGKIGQVAGGTNHHVAFRVQDDKVLMEFREKIEKRGFNITPKIDRNYFYSLYFREPGGVLFEIATDNPGFATDESVAELGTNLRLPAQYESMRKQIEKQLPVLH
ncbi:ring-cleaving dioxygenase [Paraflavitalea sp. CAU 1676]|uniref:ring-cleaving dioxygenase n=1 Tax=Paraflavitalea sp. CAU 1676 TaxID=3032598 RepID=UPI0023DA9E1F|nr:ring-cleaving dioxygenase [Paraflavitalea sp. CAU 1676]MDF2187336.1 ring-cleaving dioxygenase [Paraflavitalea sp. CAU 1676]